jgi:hypothetical protein
LDIVFRVPSNDLTRTLYFAGLIFLLFGLMGIYGSQIKESGVYGFLGFLLTILTTSIALSVNWIPDTGEVGGVANMLVPLMALTGLVGYILLGIGAWKANQLPRWTTVLWPLGWGLAIVSMALVMSGIGAAAYLHVIAFILWAAGFISAGVTLFTTGIEPSLRPAAA